MAQWTGGITLSLLGTRSYSLGGFQPTWARVEVTANKSDNDPADHRCIGNTDGTRQNYGSTFSQGTLSKSDEGNDLVVRHFESNGATIVTALESYFVAFTSTGIKLSNTIPNSNYTVRITCGN